MDTVTVVITIISSILGGAGIGGLVANYIAVRKLPDENNLVKANTYQILEQTVADLSAKLSDEIESRRALLDEFLIFRDKAGKLIEELRGETHRLKLIVGRLRNGISRLTDQIVSLGHTPVWTPDSDGIEMGEDE